MVSRRFSGDKNIEFHEFESLLLSADFSISVETLGSTQELFDNYLTQSFQSYLSKLKLTDVENQGLIFLEENDPVDNEVKESHYETFWCQETVKPKVKNVDYLTDLFCKLRTTVVNHVMDLVHDRLAADRLAFSNLKKALVEQIHKLRDAAVLHRNSIEFSLKYELSEKERFMKKDYKKEILIENQELTQDLTALQAMYDTLWLVQEDKTKKIHQFEDTILTLNENILISGETTASLRGYISMMKEKHEEEVEKLQVIFENLCSCLIVYVYIHIYMLFVYICM
jgi:hypothetical protein